MIPRVLHQVWVGGRPLPEFFATLREILRLRHPGWRLELWTDERVEQVRLPDPLAALYRAVPPGMQSDILRYVLLQQLGGWYFDVDVESLRSLDDLGEPSGCLLGWEDENTLGSAVLAAEPGHPLLDRLVGAIHDSIVHNAALGVMHQSGPAFLTRVVTSAPDRDLSGVRLAGPGVFYPVHWSRQNDFERLRIEAMYRGTAFTIHHWTGSWRDPADPFRADGDRLSATG